MSILTAENVTKIYKGRSIIKNINMFINSGEIVGLLGPNGAGKTTTFHILVGIILCNKGSITIDDEDISLLPLYARASKGIGYLPQEPSIFRGLNVLDNIISVFQIKNKFSNQYYKSKAHELMKEFQIDHLCNQMGNSLSGGERRRVEIARALAASPKFILLDEPFAGIDPLSIMDIKIIIKYLCNNGLGILITDHNVRETLNICNRAYIVNNGSLIAHGTPNQILENNYVRRIYLGEDFKL